MYEKFGPVWAAPATAACPTTKTGFGFTHDGSIPDLFRFLSVSVFNLSAANQAQQVRDIATLHVPLPDGTEPAVGRQVTCPAGTPPTGPAADEALLAHARRARRSRRTRRATASWSRRRSSGGRLRTLPLAGGSWVTDVAGEPALSRCSAAPERARRRSPSPARRSARGCASAATATRTRISTATTARPATRRAGAAAAGHGPRLSASSADDRLTWDDQSADDGARSLRRARRRAVRAARERNRGHGLPRRGNRGPRLGRPASGSAGGRRLVLPGACRERLWPRRPRPGSRAARRPRLSLMN